MFKKIASTSLIVLATMLLTSWLRPLSLFEASAQQGSCRYFEQTGRAVCGKFLAFWQGHGGLDVFGYPISNLFDEYSESAGDILTVQYFQRAVFELHPENKPPFDVQLSLVGAFQFGAKYPKGNVKATYSLYPHITTVESSERKVTNSSFIVDFVTVFQTSDSPTSVLSYYTETLPKQGWHVQTDKGNNDVYITYYAPMSPPPGCTPATDTNPCAGGAEVYVNILSTSGGITRVEELEREDTFCCTLSR